MINLKNSENQKFSGDIFVKILFYTLPLAFILGNLIVSLQLVLFIFASLFLINKKQLAFRFNNSYWILILFFLYLFLSTTIQFQSPGLLNERIQDWSLEDNPIFKSFMLVRFLILIFVLDALFFNKILDIKKLFLFSLLCTSFVSVDIIIQYVTGFDLFGLETSHKYNSGPFGEELIAGAYLKNFSFFSFFYIFTNIKNKNFSNPLLIFIITLHILAILLSGNRMPLILFLFGCVLIILLVKNLRIVMTVSLLIFFSLFILLSQNDARLKNSYLSFFKAIDIVHVVKIKIFDLVKKDGEKVIVKKEGSRVSTKNIEGIFLLDNTGYNRIYRTSIEIWKKQPLFGFGLKSFRIKCWEILAEDYRSNVNEHPTADEIQKLACGNHSHNYYFEILSEAGIIGIVLIIIFFILLLKDSFYYLKKYNKREGNSEIVLLIPVIISIFIEIWPLRSSGSFFTTWNATFFWLSVALLTSANKKSILFDNSDKTENQI